MVLRRGTVLFWKEALTFVVLCGVGGRCPDAKTFPRLCFSGMTGTTVVWETCSHQALRYSSSHSVCHVWQGISPVTINLKDYDSHLTTSNHESWWAVSASCPYLHIYSMYEHSVGPSFICMICTFLVRYIGMNMPIRRWVYY